MCGSTGLFLLPYVYHQAVARFVRGIATGLVSVAAPLHIMEVAPSRRACHICELHVFTSVGSLAAVAYAGVSGAYGGLENLPYVWLAESGLGVLVLVVSLVSPKTALQNPRKNPTSAGQILPSATSAFREFADNRFWVRLLRGAQVQASSMLTCVPAITLVLSDKAAHFGVTNTQLRWFQVVQYACLVVCSLFAVLLSNCRRKDCVVFGLVVLAATFGGIFATSYLNAAENTHGPFHGYAEAVQLALFMLVVAVFHTFVVPMAEIYSIELVESVPAAVAVTTSIMWISCAAATSGYALAAADLKTATFAVVAAVCAASAVVVMLYPETRASETWQTAESDSDHEIELYGKKLVEKMAPLAISSGSPLSTLVSRRLLQYGMAFQNFVPLFKKIPRPPAQNASRALPYSRNGTVLTPGARMVTAQTHFPEESVQGTTSLWTPQ